MVTRKKDTFTTTELCERYGVTLRTIHYMERKKGFPAGGIYSKEYVWSAPKVLAWEREHMPHLHADTVVDEAPEQAAEWNRRARQRALDRDDEKEAPPPKKKVKSSRGRKPK